MSSISAVSSPSSPDPTQSKESRSQVPLTQQPGPKLFFAGLLFVSFSAFSTRRAVLRRRLQFPQPQTLPHSPNAPVNPAIQARQSASESVLSKGQTSTPSTAQAGQGTTAPGYASAATESAQAVSHSTPNATAEAATPAVEDLQNSSMLMAVEALSLATINVLSFGMTVVGAALWKLDIRSLEEMRRMVRGGLGVDGTGRSEQEVEEEMEEWVVNVLTRKEDKERLKERLKNERGKDREL